jgi:hypothetical protein
LFHRCFIPDFVLRGDRHPQRFHQQSSLPETPAESNSRQVKVESLPQAKQQPVTARLALASRNLPGRRTLTP